MFWKVRGQRCHVDAVDENLARGRSIEPGHNIDHSCLAAAVGAYERMRPAAPHLKIDSVDRFEPTEMLAQASDLQRHRRAGIEWTQRERFGGLRWRGFARSKQLADVAPDAVGHEEDD
jgi:hypothetical protein